MDGGWQKVADDYVFDTRILTNHQPYFAAYIKVKDLLKFTDRLELVQDEWGYLLLWATLGIATIFALTLVLFPLVFGWRTIFSRYPGKAGTMVYFLCLGLGYIIVEVGMIAHFVLALSNPTVSASVLITGMLVFSGLGSFVSERFLDRARTTMPKIFLAIFAILTLYAFTIDFALDWIGTLPYALRILLCLLLLMPPAFLMGFPMPTAMTTLGRLGKDHMFLWAWGINGCFSVIGAALVPIVATSFGLPAVVLVGAIAYLVALPAFFSVLMPLGESIGPWAASGCVKRPRAAAGGAPDADDRACANKRQSRSRPSRRAKPAAEPSAGPQPLKEAKTQLVAFNASAFPYRGIVPDTRKPFLDVQRRQAARPYHLKGDVCWEDTTYSDRRSLLYLPAGYNPQLPGLIVLYLHGQGATLERDVVARQAIPRQIAESGQNIALVAPQLAYDAPDSSAGNFWKPGHFAKYIDEAAERLMRLYGDAAPAAFQRRGRGHRLLQRRLSLGRLCAGEWRRGASRQGRDPDGLALWRRGEVRRLGRGAAAARLPAQRLHRIDQGREHHLARPARQAADPARRALPKALTPGTFAFVPCGSLGDAWRFHDTRLGARSVEAGAGDDSRLPDVRRGSC